MSKPVAIRLLTKPGCHLCDDAREVVGRVMEEVGQRGVVTHLEERNILEDPELARLHAEDIPVVFVGGRRHAIWRVDPAKLARAIEKNAGLRGFFSH